MLTGGVIGREGIKKKGRDGFFQNRTISPHFSGDWSASLTLTGIKKTQLQLSCWDLLWALSWLLRETLVLQSKGLQPHPKPL